MLPLVMVVVKLLSLPLLPFFLLLLLFPDLGRQH